MAEGNNVVGALEIQVAIDSANAYAGLVPLEEKLSSTAKSADQMGTALEAGMQKIAAGAKGADEATRGVTRNLETMVQRQIALMSAGEKGTADYVRALAQLRGVGPEGMTKLEPLLQQYEQLTQKTKAAAEATKQLSEQQKFLSGLTFQTDSIGKSKADIMEMQAAMLGVSAQSAPMIAKMREAEQSMAGLGRSAKDTALAMRFVAPQVTDIVTSLASGQNAFVVMIQQGGQLKDMFGGLVPTMKVLGTYIAGMITPWTVAAGALAAFAVAAYQGRSETEAFNKALITSGNASGLTVSQMTAMSRAISQVAGTQHNAAAAVAEFGASTRIGAENTQRFASVAVQMERTIGQSFAKTREEFESIGKSPLEALGKLNEQYGFLTASTVKQIKALEDQGKSFEAAKVAMEAYASAMEVRTKALEGNLGLIERAWRAIKDGAKAAWDAMLNVGRAPSIGDSISALQAQIAQREAELAKNPGGQRGAEKGLPDRAGAERALQAAKDQLAVLQENLRLEGSVAQRKREQVELGEIMARFGKEEEQFASNRDKREKALVQARTEYQRLLNAGLITQKQMNDMLANIANKYKDPAGSSGTNSAQQQAKAYEQLINEINAGLEAQKGKTENLTAAQKAWDKAVSEGKFNDMPKTWQDAARAVFEFADAEEKAFMEAEAASKRAAEAASRRIEIDSKLQDENEAIRAQIAAQDLATRKLGESALGNLQIEEQLLDIKIQSAQIDIDIARASRQETGLLETRISLLRQLKQSMRSAYDKQQMVDADKAVAESAKREVEEFQKAADDINRALTDSLFRAAEAGKGFFETLRTSIKGMFNNIVLKPIIQASLAPVSGALQAFVSGVTGEAGVGSTGSSGSSLISTASNLKNMYELGQKAITFLGLGGVSSAGLASAAALTSGSALGSGLFSLSIPSVMTAAPAAMGGSIMGLSALGTGTMGLTAATTATTAGTAAAVTGTTAASSASILAAIPVWGWAAMAATAAAAIFGGSAGAPKGGGSATIGASGLVPGATRLFSPNTADEFAATTAGALYDSFSALATQFGGAADKISIALGFDTDPGGKAQNRIASYVQNALGEVKFLQSGRDVGRDQATLEAELATEGKRVILAALQNADLQGGYAEILARLDPATAAPDAITNLLALAASLKAFSDSMTLLPESLSRLSELSATAVEQLANASGGLDALTNNLKTYYSKFFTPQEQQATLTRQLGKLLGDVGLGPDLSLPTAEIAAWYRTTVDGIDLQTEAGRNQYAAVLALAGPMADWIDATNALTPAVVAATDAVDSQRTALETQRDDLQGQITSLESTWGDLSHSIAELENPARTVAQQILDLGSNIKSLQSDMESILGTGGLSLTEQLSNAVGIRNAIGGSRVSLQDALSQSITQGFIDRGDLQGGSDYLQTLFDWYIQAIPTADNPADFAARALSVLQQKTGIDARIISGDAQTALDLEQTARDLRIEQLNNELDTLRTLKQVSEDIAGTLYDLRTGSLSALAPITQAKVAQESFDTILSAALGGDAKAAAKLPGAANAYLTELQSFTASGGNYAGEFLRVTTALESFGATLGSVPDQITSAEKEIKNLQNAPLSSANPDMSGAIATGIDKIGTALDSAATNNDATITDITDGITRILDQWKEEKANLTGQFETVRQAWRDLVDDLENVKNDLARIAGNADFAAQQ